MNIHFIASVRSGRSKLPAYKKILEQLKKYGHVYGEQIADEKLSDFGEVELSEKDIYDREQGILEKSDVVVAEVTSPSLGVGYIIGQAVGLKKKIICLYHGKNLDKLSAMIKGDPGVEVIRYDDINEIGGILKKVLK